ncbi:MAG: hypothetical protein DHS20C01_34300 [marine bacterium B5-7]|nr:MAG: hypothetical protein DHS20C01_34300 [marine bacterium B5-7]
MTQIWFSRFAFIAALMVVADQLSAASVAGSVLLAKGAVTATGDDEVARFLARGSEVNIGDRITTADKSFVVIAFNDKTKTTLRPNTEFVIEKFSLNEADKKDEAIFELVRGGLRAVSGLIGKTNPDGFLVRTSDASMGIRGTAWDVRVCDAEDNTCAEDNKRITAGKPSAAASLAETKCLDSIDLEGQPPGVYFAVYEGRIFVMRDNKTLELGTGDAGYASRTAFGCLSVLPAFLIDDPIVFPDNIDESTPDFLELRCE